MDYVQACQGSTQLGSGGTIFNPSSWEAETLSLKGLKILE